MRKRWSDSAATSQLGMVYYECSGFFTPRELEVDPV